MKPTKNRIFCQNCNRTKMLFETKQKALNFIHFNAKVILEENDKAPVRAYYCDCCCGWHTTSIEHYDHKGPSRTKRMLLTMARNKNRKLVRLVEGNLRQAEMMMVLHFYDSAKHVCEMTDSMCKSYGIAPIQLPEMQALMARLKICWDKCKNPENVVLPKEYEVEILQRRQDERWERAIRDRRRSVLLRYNTGTTLEYQGDFRSAMKRYNDVVKMNEVLGGNAISIPDLAIRSERCRRHIELEKMLSDLERIDIRLDQIVTKKQITKIAGRLHEIFVRFTFLCEQEGDFELKQQLMERITSSQSRTLDILHGLLE